MDESLIIDYLIHSNDYCRTVLPHLREDFLRNVESKILFNIIKNHYQKYDTLANLEVVEIELNNVDNINEETYKNCLHTLQSIKEKNKNPNSENINLKWAIDTTEKYAQDRALHNAILDSIKIIDGKSDLSRTGITSLINDALSIKFDMNIGHNYMDDNESRYEQYLRQEEKIPFDIELLNTITEGGFEKKSFNVFMGSTGIGKTMVMCHLASMAYLMGYNVLYLTMEMAEIKIAKRIDANLINVPLSEINTLKKETYQTKMKKLKTKTSGNLVIKEYPTSGASALHFHNLIEELKIKKNFHPDIIFIDYINICASSRLKAHVASNPYVYIKAIAEEIRGLAIMHNVCIISATQTNRSGYKNSDADMDNTSDSWGLPQTVDFMAALITNEELAILNQLLVKQLKNRYSEMNTNKKFCVGVDWPYMRLYNCEQSAQDGINPDEDKPVMDNTRFMESDNVVTKIKKRKKEKYGTSQSIGEFLENV